MLKCDKKISSNERVIPRRLLANDNMVRRMMEDENEKVGREIYHYNAFPVGSSDSR